MAKQVEHLFDAAEKKIKSRIDEILIFLKSDSINEFSYENLTFLFKGYFFKLILNEAIEITFAGQGNYDILSNILSLISKEKLESSIMGEPMLDAFAHAINSVHTDSASASCVNSTKIFSLKKKFLYNSIS